MDRFNVKGLPENIRVGVFSVPINLIPAAISEQRGYWGAFQPTIHAIEISEDFPSAAKALETLIHEIFHAVFWINHIDLKVDDEERVVLSFGKSMAQIYADNPSLVKWVAITAKKAKGDLDG